jgi:hypothetical protein
MSIQISILTNFILCIKRVQNFDVIYNRRIIDETIHKKIITYMIYQIDTAL